MTGIRRLNAYDLPVTPGAMGPWREQGACVGAPQAWFFPERGFAPKPRPAQEVGGLHKNPSPDASIR